MKDVIVLLRTTSLELARPRYDNVPQVDKARARITEARRLLEIEHEARETRRALYLGVKEDYE